MSSVETVNWVYWSLSYEVFFYLMVAITLIFSRNKLIPIFLLLGVSLIPSLSNAQSIGFFLDHWGLFALGIGIYSLTLGYNLSGISIIVFSLTSIAINEPVLVQAVACLTGLTIWLSDHPASWLRLPNFMADIGQVSYGLYLLHVPIGCYLLLQGRQGIWLENLPLHMLYDLFVLLGCIGFSFIFFKMVEQPSIALGKVNPFWIKTRKKVEDA